jgi:competence protein CoiA
VSMNSEMLTFAVTVDGKPIFPESFSDSDWQSLKESYRVGDFITPCCRTPAIPKTSINFVRFFSHYSDGCASSPESLWHLSSKDHIARELASMGISAVLERPAGGAAAKLKSNVYFEANQRRIAVEVQHSYQHLSDYIKRQEKYSAVNRRSTLTLRRRPILISWLRSKPLVVLRIFEEFPGPVCPPI